MMNSHSLFVFILIISGSALADDIVPKIGIIGGGLSGATTAFCLRRFFGNDTIIDLYEAKDIGGRLSLIELGGYQYEAGSPGIQSNHGYMSWFLKRSGLNYSEYPLGQLGIYDGKKYVFKESYFSFKTLWDFLWHYGYQDYRHWSDLLSEWTSKFDQIYYVLNQGFAFSTVEKLLSSMDYTFVYLKQISANLALKSFGFSDMFIQEYGMAVAKSCYGQSTSINGFVGVNAFNSFREKSWAVNGGIRQLVEYVIRQSSSRIKKKQVSNITWSSGTYIITAHDIDSKQNNLEVNTYDIIVIACPLAKDLASFKFHKFSKIPKLSGEYQKTVATFVQGVLNFKSVGFNDNSEVVEEIINIDPNSPFYSLQRAYPVLDREENPPVVWKVLSQEPLSEEILDSLFLNRTAIQAVEWMAYPQYSPPEKLSKFELHPNLYHTNAIEWADSNMEMSVIASKNVALLAYNQWMRETQYVDPNSDDIETNYSKRKSKRKRWFFY